MKHPLWFWFCLLLGAGLQTALALDENTPVTETEIGQVDGEPTLESGDDFSSGVAENAIGPPLSQDNIEQLLADVEKRYGETAASLRALHKQIELKRRKIDKIELEILACQRAIAKERKDLASHVKAAYEMGQQESLKLLLNQQDPALSSRMMIYYSYINKARMAKIAQLEKSIEDLERLDKAKMAESQQLEWDLQQKQSQQTALNDVRKQRKTLLADMAATSYEEQQRYLAESENKLRGLVASLPKEWGIGLSVPPAKPVNAVAGAGPVYPEDDNAQADRGESELQGDFSYFKGKLSWPVQGRLVKNDNNLQDGILIEAKEGEDVHAVAAGRVKFAAWMRSYGYLAIIDHGNGYMTLYAYNQSLYKQVNDTVTAGEVIASVGQSGGRNQPGLYFGIRKNAQPIDPLAWCKR